jgi:exonuclease SbcD
MRIVHTGDLQLGVTTHSGNRVNPESGLNARVHDFAQRWLDCVQYAVDVQADALLVAGDVFEYPNPTSGAVAAFAQGVRLASTAMPVVLLTGNHDVPGAAGKAHTLSVFQA